MRSLNLSRLKLSMASTLVIIIGASTLFFTVLLSMLNFFNIFNILIFVTSFNIIQWLMAPYMVDLIYRVQEVSRYEKPELYGIVERLCQRTGINMPRVMVANIPIPNAFAYGSPIAGTRVAVTTELLRTLEVEEVEAILGHELGHIKHHDVQIMMFASVLPAIIYSISYSLFLSTRSRNRDRGSGASALASVSMLIYYVLTLLTLRLSRLREYYADRHCVSVVDDGARKLSEGLAKIVTNTRRLGIYGVRIKAFSNFKALYIADPETVARDAVDMQRVGRIISDQQLVRETRSRKATLLESFVEVFSTHPNIVKRLKALHELQQY